MYKKTHKLVQFIGIGKSINGVFSLAMGKILFLGQAGAGKTSIYKKYFLKLPVDEILETNPTVLFTLTKPTVKVFEREDQVVVFDLGGQKSYISSHLANDAIFSALDISIFVIDISEPEKLKDAINYLLKAHEKIRSLNEDLPIQAIFLHKFDPARQKFLLPLMHQATEMLNNAIPRLSENTYQTTLFDDSIEKAMDSLLARAFAN
ncbi:MAG: ADP-ribosylation factor-like protein [Candidatus Hodarchaeota archaeon]